MGVSSPKLSGHDQQGAKWCSMAGKANESYRAARGLVETSEPDFERPLWRKPGFNGVVSLDEMDKALSEFLASTRRQKGLNREQLAELLGISGQVYGRYERSESKLNVTRLVHLCEIFGLAPIEMIYAAAPHLFGKSSNEAANRMALMRLVSRMRPEAIASLRSLVSELSGEGEIPDTP
ncbi:helix-turn-helix transcriptional regulator [Mesorhizobium captivum]|uniref:helix-turn-helix transcriptional regulator n=1 Tax=Mesorhizobium captivum TaxID=3072319 RepID=UPI002A23CBD3|nr:helix-turn-helix transcriptional regulator [Mesorhizobium sp. VK3C]MDX8449374.1 helix-turn-helix transcriptional regulator [Mesorhizobium sp. VK3C]